MTSRAILTHTIYEKNREYFRLIISLIAYLSVILCQLCFAVTDQELLDKMTPNAKYIVQDEREKSLPESNFQGRIHCNPQSLAESGFFFHPRHPGYGVEDRVRCIYCAGVLSDWQRNDIPWGEHKKQFSDCPLITDHYSNTKFYEQKSHTLKLNLKKQFCSDCIDKVIETTMYRGAADPRYLGYKGFTKRYNTFMAASNDFHKRNAFQLALTGYVSMCNTQVNYQSYPDAAQCFTCAGITSSWSTGDAPYDEHAKYFKKCPLTQLENTELKPIIKRQSAFHTDQPQSQEVLCLNCSKCYPSVNDSRYNTLYPRIASFNYWQYSNVYSTNESSYTLTPLALAAKRFIYNGQPGCIQCCDCGTKIHLTDQDMGMTGQEFQNKHFQECAYCPGKTKKQLNFKDDR